MLITQNSNQERKPGPKILALGAAILIHLALIAVAAFIAVQQGRKEEPEIVVSVVAPPSKTEIKLEKRQVAKQAREASAQAAASPIARMLRAETVAQIAAPEVAQFQDGPIGLGEGDFGSGFGAGSGQGMGSGASFFGARVTGLGVVFDVSPSTHDTIMLVIEELNRHFGSAPTVCAQAASFRSHPGKVVSFEEAQRANALDISWDKGARQKGRALIDKIQRALEKRREVYAAIGKTASDHRLGSNLEVGVYFLMETKGCREIFVFSDFADGSTQQAMEKMARKMKARGIKLHALVVGDGRTGRIPTSLEEICKMTGGTKKMFNEAVKKRRR